MRVAVRLHRHSRAPNAEAPGVVAAAHVQPRRARGRRGLGGRLGDAACVAAIGILAATLRLRRRRARGRRDFAV